MGCKFVEGYYIDFDIDGVFPTPIPPDADKDRLPDSWEQEHYGDITNATPDTLCSNGVNTMREAYIIGLDPNSPDSRCALSIDEDTLSWISVLGRTYTVYQTTNLIEEFQPLGIDIPWSQNTYSITNQSDPNYFKLGVQLEGVYLE